jgi:hypothetical protein
MNVSFVNPPGLFDSPEKMRDFLRRAKEWPEDDEGVKSAIEEVKGYLRAMNESEIETGSNDDG